MKLLSLIFFSHLLFVGQLCFREAVGANITWTLPPLRGPVAAGGTNIRTTTQWFAQDSSELHLKWEFTFSGGAELREVTWESNTKQIGRKTASGDVTIINPFKNDFNISLGDPATLIVYDVRAADGETFTCRVESEVSGFWKDNIKVRTYVQVEIVDQTRGPKIINEGGDLHLFCEATGKPTPNITWTKIPEDGSSIEVQHRPTWNFTNIKVTDSGKYSCVADNKVPGEVPVTGQEVKVIVIAPVSINETQKESIVTVGGSVTLKCEAKGNPRPSYTWTPCRQDKVCNKSRFVIAQVQNDVNYTCKAANEYTKDSEIYSVFIGGTVINITVIITSESCKDGKYDRSMLFKKLGETLNEVFANESGYVNMKLNDVRCGSLEVYLALNFNSPTKEQDVITKLRNAVKDGKLGEFTVSSIARTRRDDEETTSKETPPPKDSINVGAAIGGSLGGAAVVGAAVVAAGWKRKQDEKNKDGKNSKGGNQEAGIDSVKKNYNVTRRSNEETTSKEPATRKGSSNIHTKRRQDRRDGDQEAGSDLGDNNYAVVGPGANYPTKGGNVGNEQGIPQYAVVDETKRKNKTPKPRKGGNLGNEQGIPDYAVVDKTKKKKQTPKAGELQYAELGELTVPGQKATMPRVSGTDTVYADVRS